MSGWGVALGALLLVGLAAGQNHAADGDAKRERGERNVAIFLHEGVELLDFSGPGEVFAATRGFNVYTVAATKKPITSQGFVEIIPQYDLQSAPVPDIVVLPGGSTNIPLGNPAVLEWIRTSSEKAEVMLSVCTGAFLLAKVGLLDGHRATTWHGRIEALREAAPKAEILENQRFVDNGKIVTTAGVSAGIDGALHVVGRLLGPDVAAATARYMEYDGCGADEKGSVRQSPASDED